VAAHRQQLRERRLETQQIGAGDLRFAVAQEIPRPVLHRDDGGSGAEREQRQHRRELAGARGAIERSKVRVGRARHVR
jgi:hypothetical protein